MTNHNSDVKLIIKDIHDSNINIGDINVNTNFGRVDNVYLQDGNKKLHFPSIPKPSYLIGRDALLADMHEYLQKDGSLLLNGLAGIGKTTVADYYANEFKDNYEYIAKVSVSGDLRQSVIDGMIRHLPVKFESGMKLQQQFEQVILALQQAKKKKPNLLILDNANNADDLVKFEADLRSSGWHILVTSRCNPDDFVSLPVDELLPKDARELFLHYYPVAEDLSALLDKINYHTLLIKLVAKASNKKQLTIEDLLKRLDDGGLNHPDLQRKIRVGKQNTELYQYISAMWKSKDLKALKAEQQQILRYFSLLPAEDIPLEHLKKLFLVEDENEFEDNLDDLFKYGLLVSKKNVSFNMHSLTQDVLLDKLSGDCSILVVRLKEIMKQQVTVAYDYLDYAKSVTQKVTIDNKEIGWLNIYLSDTFKELGQLDNALINMQNAGKIFEKIDEKNGLSIFYERIGSIFADLGNLDRALKFFVLYNKLSKQLSDKKCPSLL
jgi:tetratricopeptide (TPR) repeat protein